MTNNLNFLLHRAFPAFNFFFQCIPLTSPIFFGSRYIYTDDIQINGAGESMTLLRAGKKWGLQNLANKTVKFLDDFLNEYEPISEDRKNELCDLTVLSEELGLDLNTKCWNVLLKNVNEVVPCQGFLNMPKPMVKRLLTHQDFHFKDQLVLFEAVRDWGMNQVIQQNLSVNSLQGLIGEFLQLIDFKAIKDVDFLDTILPSECLGKAELIAFFMARGLEIPRDLVYNNNSQEIVSYKKFSQRKMLKICEINRINAVVLIIVNLFGNDNFKVLRYFLKILIFSKGIINNSLFFAQITPFYVTLLRTIYMFESVYMYCTFFPECRLSIPKNGPIY